jgi:signal transduction histidine kinase
VERIHFFVTPGISRFASVLLTRTLRSSTFKLALVCVVLFSTAVFALLGYVYWATTGYLRDRADLAISAEHAFLIQTYRTAGRDGLVNLIEQRIAEQGPMNGVYALSDPSFAVLAGNLKAWPAALRGDSGRADFLAPVRKPEAEERPRARAAYETLPDGSHLLVGREMDDLHEFVGAIKTAVEWGAGLMLVLAAFAGVSVTRRTVGRIEAINATTRDIMRSGLGKRIPLRGSMDEWDQLAGNLNSMLERIEDLVREVRQVSDNVAHDLRTPLTRLQVRLQKAYHQELDSEHYRALVGDTIRALEDILGIFSSLLRISRIEALDPRSAFRTVDLGAIAGEVAELFDAAAEEKGGRIKLASRGKAPVLGDRDLLFDAISNLIDNAIKHGGTGDVLVETGTDGLGPVISVVDHGPGIPPEERKNVLQRFYRLDHSRSSPGNGLGLSLVAAVAQLHGASIDMVDNEPGLRLQLRFPRTSLSGVSIQARQPEGVSPAM